MFKHGGFKPSTCHLIPENGHDLRAGIISVNLRDALDCKTHDKNQHRNPTTMRSPKS